LDTSVAPTDFITTEVPVLKFTPAGIDEPDMSKPIVHNKLDSSEENSDTHQVGLHTQETRLVTADEIGGNRPTLTPFHFTTTTPSPYTSTTTQPPSQRRRKYYAPPASSHNRVYSPTQDPISMIISQEDLDGEDLEHLRNAHSQFGSKVGIPAPAPTNAVVTEMRATDNGLKTRYYVGNVRPTEVASSSRVTVQNENNLPFFKESGGTFHERKPSRHDNNYAVNQVGPTPRFEKKLPSVKYAPENASPHPAPQVVYSRNRQNLNEINYYSDTKKDAPTKDNNPYLHQDRREPPKKVVSDPIHIHVQFPNDHTPPQQDHRGNQRPPILNNYPQTHQGNAYQVSNNYKSPARDSKHYHNQPVKDDRNPSLQSPNRYSSQNDNYPPQADKTYPQHNEKYPPPKTNRYPHQNDFPSREGATYPRPRDEYPERKPIRHEQDYTENPPNKNFYHKPQSQKPSYERTRPVVHESYPIRRPERPKKTTQSPYDDYSESEEFGNFPLKHDPESDDFYGPPTPIQKKPKNTKNSQSDDTPEYVGDDEDRPAPARRPYNQRQPDDYPDPPRYNDDDDSREAHRPVPNYEGVPRTRIPNLPRPPLVTPNRYDHDDRPSHHFHPQHNNHRPVYQNLNPSGLRDSNTFGSLGDNFFNSAPPNRDRIRPSPPDFGPAFDHPNIQHGSGSRNRPANPSNRHEDPFPDFTGPSSNENIDSQELHEPTRPSVPLDPIYTKRPEPLYVIDENGEYEGFGEQPRRNHHRDEPEYVGSDYENSDSRSRENDDRDQNVRIGDFFYDPYGEPLNQGEDKGSQQNPDYEDSRSNERDNNDYDDYDRPRERTVNDRDDYYDENQTNEREQRPDRPNIDRNNPDYNDDDYVEEDRGREPVGEREEDPHRGGRAQKEEEEEEEEEEEPEQDNQPKKPPPKKPKSEKSGDLEDDISDIEREFGGFLGEDIQQQKI